MYKSILACIYKTQQTYEVLKPKKKKKNLKISNLIIIIIILNSYEYFP